MKYDAGTGKYFPREEAEDHYTLTDGYGRYMHHFTKPGLKNDEESDFDEGVMEGSSDNPEKPAQIVANMIHEWIELHGLEKDINMIAGDSTAFNTGWRAGVIASLEKKMGRKFHWLICQLHTNELMLRSLIEKMDGRTDSKTGFSGPLGKLLSKVKDMKPSYTFKKINIGPGLIDLREEVVRDLNTHQHLIDKQCITARTGILPRDVALRKSGPIVHSRWLTTALTFLQMWESEHNLEGELLLRLETIVTFIVSVYCPMWFSIKVKHSWLEGPRHILTELSLFRLQSAEVQHMVLPTLKRSA